MRRGNVAITVDNLGENWMYADSTSSYFIDHFSWGAIGWAYWQNVGKTVLRTVVCEDSSIIPGRRWAICHASRLSHWFMTCDDKGTISGYRSFFMDLSVENEVLELLQRCAENKVLCGGEESAIRLARRAAQRCSDAKLPKPWPQVTAYRLGHLLMRKCMAQGGAYSTKSDSCVKTCVGS